MVFGRDPLHPNRRHRLGLCAKWNDWTEVDSLVAVSDDSDQQWLFKPVEVHSNGTIQGEDWVEKAASDLAGFQDIPNAEVELAVRDGLRGC
jgi:hypothetical protein